MPGPRHVADPLYNVLAHLYRNADQERKARFELELKKLKEALDEKDNQGQRRR